MMKSTSIDTTYCYVEDATNNPNWGKTYQTCKPETYADPDAVSVRLYQDLYSVWSKRADKQEFPKFTFIPDGKYHIKEITPDLFGKHGTRYTSDFIGVNRKLAKIADITDPEIIEYLEKQRTIGGHMLFPIGAAMSINQARGCNLLDRFDFTLAELREYFIHMSLNDGSYASKYSKQLGRSFEVYDEWLKRFCKEGDSGIDNFKRFIDYWLLGMFVSQDAECKVISLASSDLENGEEVYIESECREPYFPGLEKYPKWVNLRGIANVCSKMHQSEKAAVREASLMYIQNVNFLIDKRNRMIGQDL